MRQWGSVLFRTSVVCVVYAVCGTMGGRFCLAITLLGMVLLYELYLKRFTRVLDIASVWNEAIKAPGKGPARILIG